MRPSGFVLAFTLAAGVGAVAVAGYRPVEPGDTELARPFVPAISMDKDRRSAPEVFARRTGIAPRDLRDQVGATGLIRCGNATGTGQLTVRNDVVTTAAHVLIDQFGKHRIGCVFEPTIVGGGPVPIAFETIRTGSKMPLSERATRDWAVARLVAPVKGVTPYAIGTVKSGRTDIVMCAGGNRALSAMGAEACSTRRVIGTAKDGIREIAIDCNAGPGSSGAALIAGSKAVGIYVGYRSSNPGKARAFSATHYNFAITIEGPFRRALLSAAGR